MATITVLTSCFCGEKYLSLFLKNLAEQTIFHDVVTILVMNEPTVSETQLVEEFQKQHPGRVLVEIVRPVESLSASWNRAWKLATTPYVCIWNIDDYRTPNSLELQVQTFQKNPQAELVYGDFGIASSVGGPLQQRIETLLFEREEFSRSFILGPFFMWRPEIAEKTGYFDEQLASGADFDLAVRITLNDIIQVRAEGLLGSFTNMASGLSTSGALQPIERTVIELRYGIFDKLDYDFIPKTVVYNVPHLLQFGEWVPIKNFVPEYGVLLESRTREWFEVGIAQYVAQREQKHRALTPLYQSLEKARRLPRRIKRKLLGK
ncbi:TPA: hypothetical protein DDW35_10465 [Candidatus Sumerlaeota bacterium]|jgi:hypothetical protein|nr:hypothetical protein [Candidatus Sumerlaeota bacterium]